MDQIQDNALAVGAEEILCRKDRLRHMTQHLVIKDKEGWTGVIGEHPSFGGFKPPQKKLLALIKWCRDNGRPTRIIVLKARKTGISTLVEGDMFLEALTRGFDGIVIAHDKETAEYIFDITKRFYDNYDLSKPNTARANQRELKFDGAEGSIRVETANNVKAGTGQTPQYIHCSEVAKWAKGSETATSLFQAVGDGPNTTVILESTAYGFDVLFYPYWENADRSCNVQWSEDANGIFEPTIHIEHEDDWNGYIPLFIAWFEDPEILESPFSQFKSSTDKDRFRQTLDNYEHGLIERFQVSLEALKWRRWCIRNKCKDDINTFKQEYPSTPQEAFVSFGMARFDQTALDEMPVERGTSGELVRTDSWTRALKFRQDSQGLLTIYRHPVPGHRYVIGVDTAEGKVAEGAAGEGKLGDETVCCVVDMDNWGEQVAVLAGRISEEYVADPLLLLGEYYNYAFIVPEKTGHGQHVVIRLRQAYPNARIYHKTDVAKGRRHRSKELGFRTHGTNRPLLISDLAESIMNKAVIIHDTQTAMQCKRFQTVGGKPQAPPGEYDDRVLALALADHGMRTYPGSIDKTQSPFVGQAAKLQRTHFPSKNVVPKPHTEGYS